MKKTLRKNIADFNKLKILVVGDAILDAYIYGTTERICREAPVPVFKREQEKNCCGGAANTALNIASLGAEICFLTVLGDDENGRKIREILQQYKVDTSPVVIDKNRVTIAKKRIVASSSIILRMDEGSAFHIEKDTAKIFEDNFFAAARSADAVVISDYGFGTVTNDFINMLVTFRRQHSKLIIVDSKNLQRFQAVKPDAVKPNYEELLQLLKLEKVKKEDRAEQVIEAGNALLSLTGAKNIAATLDESGVVLLRKNRKPYFNAAVPKESKNTIGAGDTFISALTLSMGAGFEMEAAIEVASAAASIVVDREDTSLCSNLQLQAYFNPIPKYHTSRTELIQTLRELKNAGKKIVFTNGCFDIIHKGHIALLNKAKDAGDILIIGINDDASARLVKGAGRPVNKLMDRVSVLAELRSVDHIVSFSEAMPLQLLKEVKPDVFIKGGDYTKESIPEIDLLNQLGCEILIIPHSTEMSTTRVIDRINNLKREGKRKAGSMLPPVQNGVFLSS